MNRRGFTLVELLVAATVFAILGVGLARMLVSDSRFVSEQEAMMLARQTARAARNAMAVELRMVGDSGLLAAVPESVTVRIPYAFGLTCQANMSGTVASLVPPDSLMYTDAVPAGMAWRDLTGAYTRVAGIGVASSTAQSQCDADSIRVVPGGMLINLTGIPVALQPPSGRIFHLYQDVTYRFGASTELPGRRALWRRRGTDPAEELVAPFDTSARFAFLVNANSTMVEAPPADLTTVRGLELRLIGESVATPQGREDVERFRLVTRVPFANRMN